MEGQVVLGEWHKICLCYSVCVENHASCAFADRIDLEFDSFEAEAFADALLGDEVAL